MTIGAKAAGAGAAAIIGLPPLVAGVGSAEAPARPVNPEPLRGQARPVSYAELEARLGAANARVRFWRDKARRNWRMVARLRAAIRADFDPVRAGLLCIHGGEGAWSSATGNGYFGGLQMDASFMSTYGRPLVERFGYAHRWPPAAQLAVAEVAFYAGRGYGPWPNTRRPCGL